jgi:hypothetical protein
MLHILTLRPYSVFTDSLPTSNNIFLQIFYFLLKVYPLIVEGRFAPRNDPKSHAGGILSSW